MPPKPKDKGVAKVKLEGIRDGESYPKFIARLNNDARVAIMHASAKVKKVTSKRKEFLQAKKERAAAKAQRGAAFRIESSAKADDDELSEDLDTCHPFILRISPLATLCDPRQLQSLNPFSFTLNPFSFTLTPWLHHPPRYPFSATTRTPAASSRTTR